MSSTNNNTLILDIQGLRAIAILLVVLAHAGIPGLQGGFVGVDIFFVLSGFLITGLLTQELRTTGQIGLINFYSRRLKRLLPALLAMVIVTCLAAFQLLSSYESFELTRSVVFAITWTSNLFFVFRDIDYFNELETSDLFLHTWSLGVEEQFYLLWPVLLLLVFKLLDTRGTEPQQQTRGLALLAILGLASWLLSVWWTQERPMLAYYSVPTRVWQFSLGAFACLLGHRFPHARAAIRWAGLAFIACSAVAISPDRPYPGFWALLPSLGATLVLLSIAPGREGPLLANRALIWIGDRSYSWYLWHWPVLKLADAMQVPASIYTTCLLIMLSLALACISYALIEKPFWRGKLSHFQPGRTIVASLVAMILAVNGTLLLLSRPDSVDNQALSRQIQQATRDMPAIYQYGCDTWYKSADPAPCEFRAETYSRTVVLLGDSVLAQWFSLFASMYSPPEWRILVFTKSACPMVDEDFFYERISAIYSVCTEWRNRVLDSLDKLQPDIVIVGSGNNDRFDRVQWIEGSTRVFNRLSKAADQTYVLVGTPKLPFNGPACLLKNLKQNGEPTARHSLVQQCSSSEPLEHANEIKRYLSQATQQVDRVKLLDLNLLVCPRENCSAMAPSGEIAYRDSQHLTDNFVRELAPAVRDMMSAP